jgi:hypothetical protein
MPLATPAAGRDPVPGAVGRARTLRVLCLVWLTLLVAGCPTAEQGKGPLRVLFIGNSYTYANDLPALVTTLGRSGGLEGLMVESVTFPGVSLEDHWQEGTARHRLTAERWDVVVLQQGPSSQPEGRAVLLDYATRFTEEIRRAGGRPAFYSVWPDRSRPHDYDGARDSYTMAADSLDGLLFPASEAWRAAWRRDPQLALYSPDDLHPSRLGSYLVALVMIGELTGRSSVGLPARVTVSGPAGYTLDVPPGIGRLLQEAADEAVRDFGRR